jgi:hypothetical protein
MKPSRVAACEARTLVTLWENHFESSRNPQAGHVRRQMKISA